MKYRLKDHPYLFMALVVLVLLVGSVALGFLYKWSIYSVCAVILSSIGFLVLLGMAVKDYLSFRKSRKGDK